jgi:hypothetical protein
LRNQEGVTVGEAVLEGDRIIHYADAAHQVRRGYSVLIENNSKIVHFIYDDGGLPVCIGHEELTDPLAVENGTIVIPATVAGAVLRQFDATAKDDRARAEPFQYVTATVLATEIHTSSRRRLNMELLTTTGWKSFQLDAGHPAFLTSKSDILVRWKEAGKIQWKKLTCYVQPVLMGNSVDMRSLRQMAALYNVSATSDGHLQFARVRPPEEK